jgi:hypothetical protein
MSLELTMTDLEKYIYLAAGAAFRRPKDYSQPHIRAQVFNHLRQAAHQYLIAHGVETYIALETPDPGEPLGPTFTVVANVLHKGEPFTVLTVTLRVP